MALAASGSPCGLKYSSPEEVQGVTLGLLHKGTKDGGGPQEGVDVISLFLPQNRIGQSSSLLPY